VIQQAADEHYMNRSMTHKEIQDHEVIEQYVRHQLSPADRQLFQEHYFGCDECFEQVQLMSRFVAGVRDGSSSGVFAGEQGTSVASTNRLRTWFVPALAMSFLIAAVLLGVWVLSLRRENQRLAQQSSEQREAAEQLRSLEAKIRELEASGTESQQEKESLRAEVNRLKEQLAATGQPEVAQRRTPDVNVPAINIYPLGDTQRSTGSGDINRVNLPPAARSFVLILSDSGGTSSNYRVEIADTSGRTLARRAGLKPDKQGEVSVSLDRSQFSKGRYTVKLFAAGKKVSEYVVEIE